MLPSNTCWDGKPAGTFASDSKYQNSEDEKSCLSDLIASHRDLELSCDKFLTRQDELIRKIRMGCDRANLYSSKRRKVEGFETDVEQTSVTTEVNFRQEVYEINQLELQVQSLRIKIQEKENQILETAPLAVREAIEKMRFLCGIIAVCDDLELQEYVIAISESAQFVAENLPTEATEAS